MIEYAIIYGVIAVLAYGILCKYRGKIYGVWGVLGMALWWPLAIFFELFEVFCVYGAPIINRGAQYMFKVASKW